MKKRYLLYLLCLLCLFLILSVTSCARKQPQDETGKEPRQNETAGKDYDNGVYTTAQPKYDDHGWKPMATVVVEQGRISKAY